MERRVEQTVEDAIDQDAVETAMGGDGDSPDEAEVLNQLQGASDADEVRKAPKRRIIMHNQDGPGGDQPVFVAVNGMGYSIPREVPVVVPEPILKALEDAVETKYYREEKDGQSFGPMLSRQVRRFPFTVLG